MFRDMGLPWDPEVKNAVQAQRKVFESLGCIVVDAEPDFSDANEAFLAWRHWSVELAFGELLATHGDQLNQYIHWHVEEGRKLTGPYLSRIEAKRTALYQRLAALDPMAADRIAPGNRRRVVRALEVTLGSGQPFSGYGPGVASFPATTASATETEKPNSSP